MLFRSAYLADPGGLNGAGSAYLYSGATGSLLFQKDGAAAGDFLGFSVAGAGDVDGDGRADFIVGASQADPGGLTDAGSAFVYSFPCNAFWGDMNGDGGLAPADVVLMLNCVFLTQGNCRLCFADVTCDGNLSPADVVKLLNMVYLGEPVGC